MDNGKWIMDNGKWKMDNGKSYDISLTKKNINYTFNRRKSCNFAAFYCDNK